MIAPVKTLALAFGFCLISLSAAIAEEVDPASKWINAFAWIQTGDKLVAAEQWPLALGSYMEAHMQLKKVAAEHPDYEPEIVGYRLERLEESMAFMEEQLTAGDHDITMGWVDFIETLEKGQEQRFANDFESAFDTLDVARTLLEEIIAGNPGSFEDAVATQSEILTESLEWLDSQINFRQSMKRTAYVDDGTEWGTTKYVKESDLPGSNNSTVPNSMLFPGGAEPVAVVEEKEEKEEKEMPAEVKEKPARIGFRMSSKQKSASPENE